MASPIYSLRASESNSNSHTRLLSNFQQASPAPTAAPITQTDLYTAYATRFSLPPPTQTDIDSSAPAVPLPTVLALNHLDEVSDIPQEEGNPTLPPAPPVRRMLDPVELITLTRMAFPECEPVVDEQGRFVIQGIARRENVRPNPDVGEMFPFTAMNGKLPNHTDRQSDRLTE